MERLRQGLAGPVHASTSSFISASEILEGLIKHGCRDITLDLAPHSTKLIFAYEFSDLYAGRLYDGSLVAIRTLKFALDAQEASRLPLKRLARELHVWSGCQHPNVLKLLGLAVFREQIGIIFPWLDNGDLPSYIDTHPEVDRCEMSIGICGGLSFLHNKNIVHGDLQGLNTLISKDGAPVLSGFTPAKLEGLFEPNNLSRSLRWTAPELMGQSGALSFGADIYALGMIILETITGKVPYHNNSELEVFAAVLRKEHPPRPRNVIPPNTKDGDLLWELLTRCWASNPLERPSASEVLDIMKRVTWEGLNEIPGKLKEPRVSLLSTHDAITRLGEHGCQNITERLDMSSCSAYPLFGGGFGEVYRGKLQDGSQVAIKTMRVNSSGEAHKHLKNAARELHTWSKCQHPNVLKLLGLAEFRGQIGMVSAWMKKGSLPPYLDQNPEVDRCRMSTQICAGLSYLHGNQIIHGDLKGLNVLISDDGTPVLTDFGNAVLRDRTLQLTTTQDKNNISPRWTAPELMEESATYSFAADVYALAMVILETFTGKVPYAELTDHGVYVKLVLKREAPKRPEEVIPSSSQHGNRLWRLLTSCWIGDPKGRPSVDYVWGVMKLMTAEGLLAEQSAPSATPPAKTNESSAGTPLVVTRSPLLATSSSNRQGALVPKWILNCLAMIHQRYPDYRVDVISRPKAASADGTPAPPEFRLKCLDCPGKLYTTGPEETLANFEVHLKNRIHQFNVNQRLANETAVPRSNEQTPVAGSQAPPAAGAS